MIKNIAIMNPKSPTRLVTNAFLPATAAGVALEPERDEQVRAEPDALPAEEGDEEADAEHQHEHREDEQVEVGEEAAEALVAVHVPDRVEVDQRADAGDEQDPGHRQRVGEKPMSTWRRPGREPREEVDDVHPHLVRQRRACAKNITTDQTNASAISAVAIQPAFGSPMRLPNSSSTTAPSSGQRGHDPDQVEEIARAH